MKLPIKLPKCDTTTCILFALIIILILVGFYQARDLSEGFTNETSNDSCMGGCSFYNL